MALSFSADVVVAASITSTRPDRMGKLLWDFFLFFFGGIIGSDTNCHTPWPSVKIGA
jgi:hypothetical protein